MEILQLYLAGGNCLPDVVFLDRDMLSPGMELGIVDMELGIVGECD